MRFLSSVYRPAVAVALTVLAACGESASRQTAPTDPLSARGTNGKPGGATYADLILSVTPDSSNIAPGDSVKLTQTITDTTTGVSHIAADGETLGTVTSAIDIRPTPGYYGLKPGTTRGTVIKTIVSCKTAGHTTCTSYASDTAVIRLAP